MRRGLAWALVGLLLLAGCIGTDDEPAMSDEEDLEPASEDDRAQRENTTTVTLYDEGDLHAGASVPNPQGDGGLVEPVGPTATDSFEVGPEVENVSYELQLGGGTGQVRVEVYDPNDRLVYASTSYDCGGAPGGPWFCLGQDSGSASDPTSDPATGAHEVHYYVAGAVSVGLLVEGDVPASTAGNATQDV